jgi:putative Holliday junction resolvase
MSNPDATIYMAVDYGSAKVGLAVGSLVPSTPLEVVHYADQPELIHRLVTAATRERAAGIVIGWPADHLGITTPQTAIIQRFGDQLSQASKLPVIFYPETLTTHIATQKMIEAGIAKERRRRVEDSFAAAAILDDYLTSIY